MSVLIEIVLEILFYPVVHFFGDILTRWMEGFVRRENQEHNNEELVAVRSNLRNVFWIVIVSLPLCLFRVGFVGLLAAFLIFIFTFISAPSSTLFSLAYSFHRMWPFGRQGREERIRAFEQAYTNNQQRNQRAARVVDLAVEDFSADPKAFLNKYFQSTQSFNRWYFQRSYKRKDPNSAFINNSLMVPHRASINGELFKPILIALGYVENNVIFSEEQHKTLNYCFKNYTPENISDLYQRGGLSAEEYTYVIQKSITNPKVYDNVNSWSEVMDQMDFRVRDKDLLAVDGRVIDCGTIKLLKTTADFKKAGDVFVNCVAGYSESQSDIITIYQQGLPVACVDIVNKRVREISGPHNRSVTEKIKEEVKGLISSLNK